METGREDVALVAKVGLTSESAATAQSDALSLEDCYQLV